MNHLFILISLLLLCTACDSTTNQSNGGSSEAGVEANSQTASYDCMEMSSFLGEIDGAWEVYYLLEGEELGPLTLTLEQFREEGALNSVITGTLELDSEYTVDITGELIGPRLELSFVHPEGQTYKLLGTVQESGIKMCGIFTDDETVSSSWYASKLNADSTEMEAGTEGNTQDLNMELTGSWTYTSMSAQADEQYGPFTVELGQSSSNLPALLSGSFAIDASTQIELEGTVSDADGQIIMQASFVDAEGCNVTISGTIDESWNLIRGDWFQRLDAQFNCSDNGTWEATRN